MKLIFKYKKILGIFLLNSLTIFAFLVCIFCDKHLIGWEQIFICLFVLLFLNFVLVYLTLALKKERKEICRCQSDFNLKMKSCLEKMSRIYNVMEISKISFGVYHDLANILTALNLSINQIRFIKDNPEKIDLNIKESIEISQKAGDLIRFLKVQQINDDVINSFNLAKEINNCLRVFSFYFIKHKIKIEKHLDKNICLLANKARFDQIIINLISNAIDSLKKVDKNNRKIVVRLYNNFEFIKLEIKDNGIGIAKENLDKIFEAFFSLKSKKDNRHCGLGLFSIKNIIENNFNGKIKVKSELGRGARFIVKLKNN